MPLNAPDSMQDESGAPVTARRPAGLTAACIVGWLLLAIAVAGIAARWDVLRGISAGRQAAALALPVALLATLIGYWRLRRWGVWVVLIGLLARLGASVVGSLPIRPADLILPAAILVVGALYWRRLR